MCHACMPCLVPCMPCLVHPRPGMHFFHASRPRRVLSTPLMLGLRHALPCPAPPPRLVQAHALLVGGTAHHRLCQHCGVFQPLTDFDGLRSTCRAAASASAQGSPTGPQRRSLPPPQQQQAAVAASSDGLPAQARPAPSRPDPLPHQHHQQQQQADNSSTSSEHSEAAMLLAAAAKQPRAQTTQQQQQQRLPPQNRAGSTSGCGGEPTAGSSQSAATGATDGAAVPPTKRQRVASPNSLQAGCGPGSGAASAAARASHATSTITTHACWPRWRPEPV